MVDSYSFKISNSASWNCQLFYPYMNSGRDLVLCIVEFGVAAFFFEMSSQSQLLTGLNEVSPTHFRDFIVKKNKKCSPANAS